MARIHLVSAAALAGLLLSPLARAEDFRLEDVSVPAALGSYRARTIEVTGSPLTREAAQKLLSSSTPGSGEEKFAQLDAARISIPELIAESRTGDYEQSVVYRDLVLTKVVKGAAETVDAASAELSARRPGATNRGRVGAIHAEGADFPALLRVMNGARAKPDEPKRVTTRKMTIAGVEMEIEGGGKLKIGSIEGLEFSGRPLAAPLTSLAEAAPRPGGPEPSPAARRALAAMTADFLTSLDVGSLDMREVVSTMPGADKTQSETVSFKRVGLSRLADGKIGAFTLEGVSAGKEDAKLDVERIEIGGLDLRATLASAASADPKPAAPHFDRIEIAGLNMGTPDGPISLARALIEARDWLEIAPTRLSARFERAVVALNGAGAARGPLLAALGYDKLDLSGALEAKYDPQKSELSIDRIEADGAGMGTARIALFMTRVPSSLFSGDAQSAQRALPAITFWRADIGLSDRGLLGRFAQTRAKDERKTEAQIRSEFAAMGALMTRTLFSAQPNANPNVEAVATAVSAFAKGAPNLDIRAHAPDGIGLLDLSLATQMGSLAERLKIDAKAR